MDGKDVVLHPAEYPLLESPDGMMRDSILITNDTCGSDNVSAGLVWVHPHGEIHEDTHAFDEVYYVIRGSAEVVMDGSSVPAAAGDVVFIRAGVRHRIANPTDETFQIFWLIATRWGDLHSVKEELGRWPHVPFAKGWHVA